MQIQFSPKFEKSFPYASKKEEKEQLRKLSKEVAEIWGQFLKAETHTESNIEKLYESGFHVNQVEKKSPFPETKLIQAFQKTLAKNIRSEYRKRCHVAMTTDYRPEHILSEALEESGITNEKFPDLYQLFPCKSGIWIRYSRDESSFLEAIGYELNFGGSFF